MWQAGSEHQLNSSLKWRNRSALSPPETLAASKKFQKSVCGSHLCSTVVRKDRLRPGEGQHYILNAVSTSRYVFFRDNMHLLQPCFACRLIRFFIPCKEPACKRCPFIVCNVVQYAQVNERICFVWSQEIWHIANAVAATLSLRGYFAIFFWYGISDR